MKWLGLPALTLVCLLVAPVNAILFNSLVPRTGEEAPAADPIPSGDVILQNGKTPMGAGYGDFSWGNCCDRVPSRCDNIWDGFCDQRCNHGCKSKSYRPHYRGLHGGCSSAKGCCPSSKMPTQKAWQKPAYRPTQKHHKGKAYRGGYQGWQRHYAFGGGGCDCGGDVQWSDAPIESETIPAPPIEAEEDAPPIPPAPSTDDRSVSRPLPVRVLPAFFQR